MRADRGIGRGMGDHRHAAATRSLINGTSFGDNITAVLPDVIAQTIGDLIANGISGIGDDSDEIVVTANGGGSDGGVRVVRNVNTYRLNIDGSKIPHADYVNVGPGYLPLP